MTRSGWLLALAAATTCWLLRAAPWRLASMVGNGTGGGDALDRMALGAGECALLAVALWLLVGCLAVEAGALAHVLAARAGHGTSPTGGLGHLADRASRALLPAALRRVVAGSAGLGILLAPAAAGAAPAAHAAGSSAPSVVVATAQPGAWQPQPGVLAAASDLVSGALCAGTDHPGAGTRTGTALRLAAGSLAGPTGSDVPADPAPPTVPGPRWPASPTATGTPTAGAGSPTAGAVSPGPAWPVSPVPAQRRTRPPTQAATTPPTSHPTSHPTHAATTPPTSHPTGQHPTGTPRTGGRTGSPDSTVRVAAGDSLWLIAQRRLATTHAAGTSTAGTSNSTVDAAAVARYWPRIYAANRAVIGSDPSLIRPGQHLVLPAVPSRETP